LIAYPSVQHVYDNNQNLIQVLSLVDRNAGTYSTNSFSYTNAAFPHYITGIANANGTQVAKNLYDSSGRLTEVDDANGNKTQFFHSTNNNTEVVVDRLNNTNSYVYDLQGNIVAETNALGQIKLMAYDGNNNKTTEVCFLDGQPYATNRWFYDQTTSLLLYSINPLGYSNVYTYNQYGQVLTSLQPCGCAGATNYYDGSGNLTNSVDALGHATLSFYDPATGLLVESVDPIGTVATNYYDGFENLIATATIDASGVILSSNTFAYDANNNRTNSTVWRVVGGTWVPSVTASIYDGQNRVVQTVNPDAGTNTVIYDPTGRQQVTIDPLGHTTSYAYDAQGRLTNTTYPDMSSVSCSYDANGNRTNSVDQLGRVTTYVYDALNRPTQTIYADSATNTTVYDDLSRVQFTIDARGTTNAFGYDGAGQRIAVTNAWGTAATNISFYAFDANGNQIGASDALGHVTRYTYDGLNRQVQVVYADGTMTGTSYDAAGRAVATTNQDQIVTLFGYDGVGRLTSVTNAFGTTNQIVTRYAYDQAGNQTNQVDALGRITKFAYDSMGRRISRTMPGGQTESFAYDVAGNQLLATNFNGAVISNAFNVMGRLVNRGSGNGYQIMLGYDAAGNRSGMTDPSGTTTYVFDSRNRLASKTQSWNGGPVISLSYGYDGNGNVSNIHSSTSNGVNLGYAYDPANRITNVLAGGTLVASYGFDPNGNLQSVHYGNGATNVNQYDALNRLTNSVWKSNSLTLASFYYELGATGSRTNLTETLLTAVTNRAYAWQYDSLYRLISEGISGIGTNAYGQDKVGNRTNRTAGLGGLPAQNFSYSSNDWLTSDAYDANGNTLWSTNGAAVTGPYCYDVENRLTNFNNAVYLAYNGDGLRVRKTANGTNFFYLVDDRNPTGYAQVLEEWAASGASTSLAHVYNYGLALVSQDPGSTAYYFVTDGHGSARLLAGSACSVANALTYDGYGNLVASGAAPQTLYLCCGEQFDPHLSAYYLRSRLVSQGTGRFLTRDTYQGRTGQPASLHLYLYCYDNPINAIDPSGHEDLAGLGVSEEAFGGQNSWTQVTAPRGTVFGKCGPRVDEAVNQTLADMSASFAALPDFSSKYEACENILINVDSAWNWGVGWLEGMAAQRVGDTLQNSTATYDGKCFERHTLKFFLFGHAAKLCNREFPRGEHGPPFAGALRNLEIGLILRQALVPGISGDTPETVQNKVAIARHFYLGTALLSQRACSPSTVSIKPPLKAEDWWWLGVKYDGQR